MISADVDGGWAGLVSFAFGIDPVDAVDSVDDAEPAEIRASEEVPLQSLLFFFLAMVKIYLQEYLKRIIHGNTSRGKISSIAQAISTEIFCTLRGICPSSRFRSYLFPLKLSRPSFIILVR